MLRIIWAFEADLKLTSQVNADGTVDLMGLDRNGREVFKYQMTKEVREVRVKIVKESTEILEHGSDEDSFSGEGFDSSSIDSENFSQIGSDENPHDVIEG